MQEILNILGSVGFNWHVALANFVNFLIILFLLRTFFFKKIGTVIEKRQETIEQGLLRAQEGEALLMRAEEEKHALIKEGEQEKNKRIKEGEEKGKEMVARILSQGEEEIRAQRQALIEQEKDLAHKVEKEFLLRAPELVASLYASTLKKEMTEEENNAFISRSI